MELTQTQYHGGFFYIERIHKILINLNEVTARRTNNATQMINDLRLNYNLLNDLFKELSAKMNKPLRDEHIMASETLKKKLEIITKDFQRTKQVPMELELKLDGWEVELRSFAEKKGLLVPDKMSPGEALGW